MIELQNCPYKDKCKKFNNSQCPTQDKSQTQFCIKLFKIDELQNKALLTNKQKQYVPLRLDIDGSDREAFIRLKQIEQNIEQYVQEGNNLYIFSGRTGNGKTSWALRLLNSFIESIWYKSDIVCRGIFINVPKFLISLRDNISQKNEYIQHIKENALNADIIIWDDIATKGFTTFEMENIYNIVNSRLDEGKSNFYTSNLVGQELKEAMGDRLYSRVMNASEVLEFVGADKRGLK